MKPLPFMAALILALPVSAAATVSMEAQQTTRSDEVIQSTPAAASHRPLFIVKYVLRPAPREIPQIVMDDQEAQILAPGKDFPAGKLGTVQDNPNMVVCYGWGCERNP